jgi:predicted N-acetyltransferase YhbS
MTITIDVLTSDDLEATNVVVMAAYNVQQSRMEALSRHLLFQPDGSFVAKDDGVVVGFGAVVDYGLFAYIGLMSVVPSMQKRGIGAMILERSSLHIGPMIPSGRWSHTMLPGRSRAT